VQDEAEGDQVGSPEQARVECSFLLDQVRVWNDQVQRSHDARAERHRQQARQRPGFPHRLGDEFRDRDEDHDSRRESDARRDSPCAVPEPERQADPDRRRDARDQRQEDDSEPGRNGRICRHRSLLAPTGLERVDDERGAQP
jgi:hypothetical protein